MTAPEPELVSPGDEGHGATVVLYENGPMLLRGDFTLRTPDGEVIEPGRSTVALCRCGKSTIKPFCDGTHRAVNFRANAGRDTPSPRDAGSVRRPPAAGPDPLINAPQG
jgi:CDGSH-type Zn-finger protein